MQKVVNFLRGSVRLELTGAFPERFLNICAAENLPFWQVEQPDETTLRLTLARQDRKWAEEIAERSMCQATELGRQGLPAFMSRFKKRYALLAGLAISILLVCVLSRFVLVVQVTGNERVSSAEICSVLSRLGFGVGSYGPAVDERELVNQALLELKDVGFLSINIKGVRAEVVVREAPEKPEISDKTRPADVIAARDGVILEIGAKMGKKMVKEGDAVLKGEVLISGLVTHKSGDSEQILSSEQLRAEGEVWAVTERTMSRSVPLKTQRKRKQEQVKNRYSLRLMDRRINFYRNSSISGDNYDKISSEYTLTLPGGLVLPVTWIKTQITSYQPKETALTRDSAEAYLKKQLEQALTAAVGDGEVLSKSWKVQAKEDLLTVTVQASCNEQIGQTLELEQDGKTEGQTPETQEMN